MPALHDLASEKLAMLARLGRARSLIVSDAGPSMRVAQEGASLVNFGGNDYLGLSTHPSVLAAAQEALRKYGAGAGASRLVTGNHALYAALEQALAAWKEQEASLVFGSGYLANLGAMTALMGRGDLILADRLIHACLLDGARLSGARLMRFQHNDVQDAARLLARHRVTHRHALIVTESVFSMDGDVAPLSALSALARAHEAWLLVDTAHSVTPVTGEADVIVGTLSKTFGGYGGYVAARRSVVTWLGSAARPFLFSTGLPPATVAAAAAAVRLLLAEPERAAAPLAYARRFTARLGLPQAASPIVPIMLGSEASALQAMARLRSEGYYVPAIRPPTVPEGTARLRVSFSALHTDEQVEGLAEACRRLGLA